MTVMHESLVTALAHLHTGDRLCWGRPSPTLTLLPDLFILLCMSRKCMDWM